MQFTPAVTRRTRLMRIVSTFASIKSKSDLITPTFLDSFCTMSFNLSSFRDIFLTVALRGACYRLNSLKKRPPSARDCPQLLMMFTTGEKGDCYSIMMTSPSRRVLNGIVLF